MKTIACADVGEATCPFTVTAETVEDAKQQMLAHGKEAHPDLDVTSTPEAKQEWESRFEDVWDAEPEA